MPGSLLEVPVSVTQEMTNRQLVRVHGHSIADLENLLQNACDLFNGDLSLEHQALGGWSNINIRGQSNGIDFVLKLPWSTSIHDITFYKKLYDVSKFFHERGIASFPLAMGRLPDTKETPFLIFEYARGKIHDSLAEFATHEIESLKTCLKTLSHQKPPGLHRFKSASEHLNSTYKLVDNHEGISIASRDVIELIDSFIEVYHQVLSHTDKLDRWSELVMHGDLWVPNIVLQSGKIILLDFEACAYGNQFYDLAYLLETPANVSEHIPTGLVSAEDTDEVKKLRPLAVSHLIGWSLERLLSMESGLVEPNLNTKESRTAIIDYTHAKLFRLKALLA
ncbi:MAG: aminoglycoside phosphotransferase family protein [Candidatus Sifarchaeia archaeon]